MSAPDACVLRVPVFRGSAFDAAAAEIGRPVCIRTNCVHGVVAPDEDQWGS
jgi:hypothetical protein